MSYVDQSYYQDEWHGTLIDTTDFNMFNSRAEDIIDQISRYRISESGISSFNTLDQKLIKKAVCAQMDYLAYNGVETAISGIMGASFTAGKISVSGGAAVGRTSIVCPMARNYLQQTGLLYAGVCTATGGVL